MDLARDPGGQPAYGGAPGLLTGGGRDPDRDAHAHQVQVGAEDVLRVGAALDAWRQGLADLREQPQGERVPVVARGEGVRRDVEPLPRLFGLGPGEVGQAQRGREAAGGAAGAVQGVRRVEGPGGLPVLGAAGDDEPDAVLAQPAGGARRPFGQPVGQQRRHLLGAVEDHEEGWPASAARRATRSAVAVAMSPRAPAAATIRAERVSVRSAASATEVSSASRSAPRSQRVGAGAPGRPGGRRGRPARWCGRCRVRRQDPGPWPYRLRRR